ncbi:hypothetical protein SteCoe_17634 [Stentor coeruleus]|uniref:Uncharacterized protein n=1 Tax=Stentor coeruleus TaxID=5963 RepID=A0A1R2BYG3_9CILI|nr:hypothetical protein SteCoe_17634 [Stentor coeruleus]
MNFEKLALTTACDEILDELPVTFLNCVLDVEEEYKCRTGKYISEIQSLQSQIQKYQIIQKKTAAEKQYLKNKAMEMDAQNDANSSYFFYNEKELEEELKYSKQVIKYAKSKIKLYELVSRIAWNENAFAGEILKKKSHFEFPNMTTYEQINKLWELL